MTARWTAAVRARESLRPDALFRDPWALSLGGAEGEALRMRMKAAGIPADLTIVIRTHFIDEALRRWLRKEDPGQVVALASGLCTRAMRLPLPADLHYFEVDRREIQQAKAQALAALDATPACAHALVEADLREAWPQALRNAGFRRARTLWIVEGLVHYLLPADVHHLLATLSQLCCRGDTLLIDMPGRYVYEAPQLSRWLEMLRAHGSPWQFGCDEPEQLLLEHGWDAHALLFGQEGANFGRWPWPVMPREEGKIPRSYLVEARRAE